MNQTKNMDVHELDDLVIPNCLLEAAELAENCDLNIQCVPGAIIIGSSDLLDTIPEPLMKGGLSIQVQQFFSKSLIRRFPVETFTRTIIEKVDSNIQKLLCHH